MLRILKKYMHPGIFLMGLLTLGGCARRVVNSAAADAPTGRVQEDVVPVRLETVHPRPVTQVLRWTATTMPRAEVSLTFKGSGRIRKLFFEEGAFVRKGQKLGQLVEEDYWSYAQLARVQVRTLEPDAKRLENLAAADAVPRAEAERMRGQANVARAQLRQAEAALSGVFLNAPMDGIIEKKSVSQGDLVSPAREVARLVDLSQVRVQLAASEEELAFLKPQARVKLRFFHPRWETEGFVERISPMADFRTRTFPVSVLVDNAMENGQWKLRAGMRVEVTLERPLGERITVPFPAVLQDEEGVSRVCVAENGRARCLPVQVGRLLEGRLEILQGLSAGQQVIVSGQHYLRNDSKIAVLPAEPASGKSGP